MKVCLAFNYEGVNQSYHWPLWKAGVQALGWEAVPFNEADFVVVWGVLPSEYHAAIDAGKPVLVCDFPYWNRGGKNRNGEEYYKVGLNGQHPTKYVMTENHDKQRYMETKAPQIRPWKKKGQGDYILLAGMGRKAAAQFGYEQGQWERRAASILKSHSTKPILYRPKPGHNPPGGLQGVMTDNGAASIEEAIRNACAVACHHGNPTVDALALGVPIFMQGKIGVASHLACLDMKQINEPVYPEGREQFFYNLAHWQWSVAEIRSGKVLQSYKDRGLI